MNSKNLILILILLLAVLLAGCVESAEPIEEIEMTKEEQIEAVKEAHQAAKEPTGESVVLKTNFGDIVIELYDNMPITTGNFKKLVSEGFYNGVIFHRIIPDFMIQGGDPTGTGTGGPGYTIPDEFSEGSSNLKGTIAMANSGPNSGGSQFFINLIDNSYLDWDKEPQAAKHPVFGKVIDGMDVVEAIGRTSTGPGDKPVKDVVINTAEVLK
jgi:peptidylprolyl isomerase|tara:strand:+ start:2733 stop:3368 length:636 start_codon:yes stop_codon:yes gene_type:complete